MNRRISLALIAATSTLLASVTPAVAQSSDLSSSGSAGGEEATTTAPAPAEPEVGDEDTNTPDDVEQGSTFMGPHELASSIATGRGSSGMPEDWVGHNDDGDSDSGDGTGGEDEEINLDDYPEWMHSSLDPSDEVETLFVVLNAILAVGAAATQAAVVLAPFIGTDRIREFLTGLGINVDA